jgi:hypothetical protein
MAWGDFQNQCEVKQLITPSYETYRNYVQSRDQVEQTRQRQGPGAAYQGEEFVWELLSTTPRQGSHPWEVGYIDHTQADLELIDPVTGKNLGRPWVSFYMSGYRRILAVSVSFDPPSYRTCMMLIRICVKRHGRLTKTTIVDGAKEFASVYFDKLLALLSIHKKTRPWKKPRFGSTIERLFDTANTNFFHNLEGNTQSMKNPRMVSHSFNPKRLAIGSLPWLVHHLDIWAYDVYEMRKHSTLGMSPREAYQRGIAALGERQFMHIPYDDSFIRATLPGIKNKDGKAKVHAQRGIQYHYVRYWCPAFRQRNIEGSLVSVKYDPFDIGHIFAFVNGRWEEARSEYYMELHGHSERESYIATAELRERKRRNNRERAINARQIAAFLAEARSDAHERQRLCDQARVEALEEQATEELDSSIAETQPADTSSESDLDAMTDNNLETDTTDEQEDSETTANRPRVTLPVFEI